MYNHLQSSLKYIDFFKKMNNRLGTKTKYEIEVYKCKCHASLYFEESLAKKLHVENEVYLTPLRGRDYALASSFQLNDDSIRIELEKDSTISSDTESIINFLTSINMDSNEFTSHTFEAIIYAEYAILLL